MEKVKHCYEIYMYYNLDFFFQHPEKQISAIEGSIIETLITMVMKLSESTFKPLLFKVKY